MGLILGQGTKIPQADQKEKKKRTLLNNNRIQSSKCIWDIIRIDYMLNHKLSLHKEVTLEIKN